MIDDFAKLIPNSLMDKPGAAFFSGRSAFSNPSNLYILGINPGGDAESPNASTISVHIKDVLHCKLQDWSNYRDNSFGRFAPGKHFLQKNILHLLKEVGEEPHEIPASEVVFLGSKNLSKLKGDFRQLADECWPFHEAVIDKLIDKLGIRVVVCYGKPSGEYVRRRLKASTQVDEFVASHGRKTFTSRTYRNADGLTVVTLWFPGYFNPHWTNPKTDPTGLVVNALEG